MSTLENSITELFPEMFIVEYKASATYLTSPQKSTSHRPPFKQYPGVQAGGAEKSVALQLHSATTVVATPMNDVPLAFT